MNPTVKYVVPAFGRVPTRPVSIAIDRRGVVLPKGGHFQGIQRLQGRPETLVITSSSDTQGYFVVCDMAADDRSGHARAPVTMAISPLTHAGGCQTVGSYLIAGLEDPPVNASSQVQFWDLTRSPGVMLPMTIFRRGKQHGSTAGAVGISSYGNGAVLAVAAFDANTVDFYTSAGDPFAGSPFVCNFTWSASSADKTGWIDGNFGSYQNINLITQSDGQVFMVAFDRAGNTDWMDLFHVDLQGTSDSALKKLARKHMYCTDGCSFDAGAGIFILSSASFEVYAVNKFSGDHDAGRTIQANLFSERLT